MVVLCLPEVYKQGGMRNSASLPNLQQRKTNKSINAAVALELDNSAKNPGRISGLQKACDASSKAKALSRKDKYLQEKVVPVTAMKRTMSKSRSFAVTTMGVHRPSTEEEWLEHARPSQVRASLSRPDSALLAPLSRPGSALDLDARRQSQLVRPSSVPAFVQNVPQAGRRSSRVLDSEGKLGSSQGLVLDSPNSEAGKRAKKELASKFLLEVSVSGKKSRSPVSTPATTAPSSRMTSCANSAANSRVSTFTDLDASFDLDIFATSKLTPQVPSVNKSGRCLNKSPVIDDELAQMLRSKLSKCTDISQSPVSNTKLRASNVPGDLTIEAAPVEAVETVEQVSKPRMGRGASVSTTSLAFLARKWHISLENVKDSAEIFTRHAVLPKNHCDGDIYTEGVLSKDAMMTIVCELADVSDISELSPEAQRVFVIADANNDGEVDFQEFAVWHNQRSFCKFLNLSKEQVEVRNLGEKLGVAANDIDYYKQLYDKFDADGSGDIDEEEFTELMHICMKLPKHIRIPESRVKLFWRECDLDGSGGIDLEEFVSFYKKHFDKNATEPVDDYYRSIRRSSFSQPL